MSLHRTIQNLAARFADDIVNAIRSASLQELLAETRGRKGKADTAVEAGAGAGSHGMSRQAPVAGKRLARRTQAQIDQYVDAIVALLKKHPEGLRAEQIQRALGLDKRETPRPIAAALQKRLISKKGEKRATTYFSR
jgi:hypothetical protein